MMLEWFQRNFAIHPERGSSGPYQPKDELLAAFGDQAKIDEIEEVADVLSRYSDSYIALNPRIEQENRGALIDVELTHLGGQLDQVEKLVGLLRDLASSQSAGPRLGHNRPPEALEPSNDAAIPDSSELSGVENSIDDVRNELAKRSAGAPVDPATLEKAVSRFEWLREKLGKLSTLVGAGLITGAAGLIGKTIFETLGGVSLVTDVLTTILNWIHSVQPPY